MSINLAPFYIVCILIFTQLLHYLYVLILQRNCAHVCLEKERSILMPCICGLRLSCKAVTGCSC